MVPGQNGEILLVRQLNVENRIMDQRNYQEVEQELKGQSIRVITYQIGQRYNCHIEIKDPGAVIARGSAATLSEARSAALKKAEARLSK